MNILRVDRLTQRFGALAAVSDLTFELEEGEIFGIAGPNGAGKSTLFNAITGFYKHTGDIYLKNQRISGLRPHQICQRGVSRTFQIPQLFATLPVYENLKIGAHFGAGARGSVRENRIEEIMELVGLTGKGAIQAVHLSLFDKKLTMLGSAMLTRPFLLLVDEPTAGLSPTETTEFVGLLKRINESFGVAIIVIEHMMKVLTALSRRMMIMENGKKLVVGSPAEVTSDERVIQLYLGTGKHA